MRIALVDLIFGWPPRGGADVDLYHVTKALEASGHVVKLFGVGGEVAWDRGGFEPEDLPFPAERLDFGKGEFTKVHVPGRVRQAVDAWGPEAVVLADGFFLKPYVALALASYPLALRYYAHEAACQRDILRFEDGAPCSFDYLANPERCRPCGLEGMKTALRSGPALAWSESYLAAEAYSPVYHETVRQALEQACCAIAYNAAMLEPIREFCPETYVVPGGVDTAAFPYAPPPEPEPSGKRVILMAGRAEDPVKGLPLLIAACKRLARQQNNFVVRVTAPESFAGPDWLEALGWLDREELRAQYAASDICVVPSIWEEPFGLTALEAMASGRPVCASRVGGLRGIVRDDETGFLFERGDEEALAACLGRLLDDAALRRAMGEAGRKLAEERYAWDRVVRDDYGPVLACLEAAAGQRP